MDDHRFASGGIVQPAQDGDSVPLMFDNGYVLPRRTRSAMAEPLSEPGYDLLAVRIRRGTTINGAIVALCPDEHDVVTADVCIDGPPVP